MCQLSLQTCYPHYKINFAAASQNFTLREIPTYSNHFAQDLDVVDAFAGGAAISAVFGQRLSVEKKTISKYYQVR